MATTGKRITIRRLFHREMHCLALHFERNNGLILMVKRIPGIKFSITHKCWYVPDTQDSIDKLEEIGKHVEVEWTVMSYGKLTGHAAPIPKEKLDSKGSQSDVLEQMSQKLKIKGYSGPTIATYVSQFKLFLDFLGPNSLKNVTEKDIHRYQMHLIENRKVSKSTQNQAINAIKFYFEKMLGQARTTYYVERPMKEQKLPTILSEDEVARILEAVDNDKHRLMLMIIYSAGLRRSELLNLHVGDLDVERDTVFVKGGKGFKDRTTILASRLRKHIEKYLEEHKPQYWMFEGVNRSRYSASALQQIFRRAVTKAGIKKEVSLHNLRHSFATHLLEGGAATIYIQKLLGHESSKTTEIYAQVTRMGMDKIRSPFDRDIFGKNAGEK